jgi:hypothetical protein
MKVDCLHHHLKTTLTPAGPHHGRLDCLDCGRFVGWAKKPETLLREHENEQKMKHLVKLLPHLGRWEQEFIQSLRKQMPKISPRQQEKLDQVFKGAKYP